MSLNKPTKKKKFLSIIILNPISMPISYAVIYKTVRYRQNDAYRRLASCCLEWKSSYSFFVVLRFLFHTSSVTVGWAPQCQLCNLEVWHGISLALRSLWDSRTDRSPSHWASMTIKAPRPGNIVS